MARKASAKTRSTTDEDKIRGAWRGVDRATRDGFANCMAGVGNERDKTSYGSYGVTFFKNQQELEAAFTSSWIARRIVSTIAEEMTREWVNLSWDESQNDEEGPRTIANYEKRLGLRSAVTEALRWGRLFGGAGILLGVADEQDLSQPIDMSKIGPGFLRSIKVFDRWQLTSAGDYDPDINSPNFDLPLTYTITSSGVVSIPSVHWTRIVRFGGDPLPRISFYQNARWPASVLQAAYEAVRRYDGVTAGIASMIWETNVDILKIKNLFELMAVDQGAGLASRMQSSMLMKSFNRILVLDSEEEFAQKTMHFAGLRELLQEFRVELCGAADVPATRLFGESPGGMNATGESDLTNYYDHIAARQESNLRPQLERIYNLLVPSALGGNAMPKNFSIDFAPLWQMSEAEKGKMQKEAAERDHIYWADGIVPGSVIAKNLKEDRTYDISDEDIKLAEEMEKAPQPLPPDPKVAPAGTPGAHPAPAGEEPEQARQAEIKKSIDALDARTVRDRVGHEASGWFVYSESGEKKLGGPYPKKGEAVKRLGQIEYFKAHDAGKNTGSNVVIRRVVQGFNVAIENPAGTIREWKDEGGKVTGAISMKFDYGFFEDFMGSDGDELDVYVGTADKSDHVYVIKQLRAPDFTVRDEDKVMLCFSDPAQAIGAFLAHRNDGDKSFGGMSAVPLETFRKKLQRRTGTGPIRV